MNCEAARGVRYCRTFDGAGDSVTIGGGVFSGNSDAAGAGGIGGVVLDDSSAATAAGIGAGGTLTRGAESVGRAVIAATCLAGTGPALTGVPFRLFMLDPLGSRFDVEVPGGVVAAAGAEAAGSGVGGVSPPAGVMPAGG
jgi:hypothetical protein